MNIILKIAGPHKPKVILSVIYKVIQSFFAVSPYFFLFLVLEKLFQPRIDKDYINRLMFCMGGCFFLNWVFFHLYYKTLILAVYDIIYDLRISLGEHLRKLSMGFITGNQTGNLTFMATEDIRWLEFGP